MGHPIATRSLVTPQKIAYVVEFFHANYTLSTVERRIKRTQLRTNQYRHKNCTKR